ncbi:MAG: serine/threonine protein kinase [Cystobacterineae bacterium]|nr:serine/threonine protein kinase [Cystobacterineae bacterium]
MPPKTVGPYRILEKLGSGGVGTVYKAIDRRSNECVALKLLSTGTALDVRVVRRLTREYETLQGLSHPNVVRVYDTGVHRGYPYLTMELVEGLTLRHYLSLSSSELTSDNQLVLAIKAHLENLNKHSWDDEASRTDRTEDSERYFGIADYAEEAPSDMEQQGPESIRALAKMVGEPDTAASSSSEASVDLPYELPATPYVPVTSHSMSEAELIQINRPERVGRLKDVFLQLAQALSHIHGRGLIHRDLKPSNIMVNEDRVAKLMDFGLAKFISDDLSSVTNTGNMVGTFRYMAPEQILGEHVDARADLYSLGVILYELLSGRPPFEAKTPYELWRQVLETEPRPIMSINAAVDRQMAQIAQGLMNKEPDDRIQTAEEVYEALWE